MPLVERLVIGSGAGPSASLLTSLSVSGVSATDDSLRRKSSQRSALSVRQNRTSDSRYLPPISTSDSSRNSSPPLTESRRLTASHVEPGCDPDVLDGEDQPQNQFNREQPQHRDGEELEGHVLQKARAREQFGLELARR